MMRSAQTSDLPCRDAVELVTEYLEGALIPELERALRDHLDGCRGCRAYLDQVRQSVDAMRALGASSRLTVEARDRLLDRLRQRLS